MAKAPPDIRSLARSYTELAITTLGGIAQNSPSDQAKVAACVALLDRGWGKPKQPVSGDDESPVKLVIEWKGRSV